MMVSRMGIVLVDLDKAVPKEVKFSEKEGYGVVQFEKRKKREEKERRRTSFGGEDENIDNNNTNNTPSKKKSGDKRKPNDISKSPSNNPLNANFAVIEKYANIIHASFIGPDELVVVEQPWSGKGLKAVQDRKVYGT